MSAETNIPAFEKAKALFPLQNPEPATDDAWNLYILNRLGAPHLDTSLSDPENEDEARFVPNVQFLDTVGRALSAMEKKMNLTDDILWESCRIIHCYVHYGGIDSDPDHFEGVPEDAIEPEILSVITRIYSPSRPLYIDVCLEYRWMFGDMDAGFNYFMAFKIHTSPAQDDYQSTEIQKMREAAVKTGSTADGWHVIAYGYKAPESNAVRNVFMLNHADIKNIRDTLWGTQDDLPEDADEARKIQRRRELVNAICVLFAGVGIQSNFACLDDEKDVFSYWLLGSIRNWLAREVRKACGFQLHRDQGAVSQDAGTPSIHDDESDEEADDFDDDDDNYDDEHYMY